MILTERQCAKKTVYQGRFLSFTSRRDLGNGVEVRRLDKTDSPTLEEISSDVSEFTAMFMLDTWPLLGGFVGMDCIRFKFIGFPKKS